KSYRTRPACLRFPPPPPISLSNIASFCMVRAAPASKMRSLSGEVVRPRPAPWSAPLQVVERTGDSRWERQGAEGLPGLSARDPGDERRHSNSRMGFGEAQDPRDRPAAV